MNEPTAAADVTSHLVVVGRLAVADTLFDHVDEGATPLFLGWEDYVEFSDAHPGAHARYLELDAARREIEADALRWATEIAPLAVRALGTPAKHAEAVSQAARRILQHDICYRVARARRTAAEIAACVAERGRVDALGIDDLTAAFLTAAAPQRSIRVTTVGTQLSAPPTLIPGVKLPLVRVAAGAARHLASAGGRSAARRVAADLRRSHERVVAFMSQAPRDEAIAGPAVERIRESGAAIVKVDLSRKGRMLASRYPADAIVDVRDWIDPYPPRAVIRYLRRRAKATRTLASQLPSELTPVADSLAPWAVREAGITAPSTLATAGSLLDDLAPERIVVLGETARIVEPLAIAARERDVPIVNVQHGIIHAIPQWAEMPFTTFAVYGPAYAEVLTSLGTPAERIVVVGDPRLDSVASRETRDRADMLAGLRPFVRGPMPSSPFVVLFAANYATNRLSGASMERTFRTLAEGLAQVPDSLLVVKLHPQGAGRELPYERALRDGLPVPIVVAPRDTPLLDLIDAADAVAIHVSSVGFEAAAVRKPVVVVKTDEGIQEIPFVAEGIAAEARNASEVRAAFERIRSGLAEITDETYERFDERYHFILDGQASERLAEVIENASW